MNHHEDQTPGFNLADAVVGMHEALLRSPIVRGEHVSEQLPAPHTDSFGTFVIPNGTTQ